MEFLAKKQFKNQVQPKIQVQKKITSFKKKNARGGLVGKCEGILFYLFWGGVGQKSGIWVVSGKNSTLALS